MKLLYPILFGSLLSFSSFAQEPNVPEDSLDARIEGDLNSNQQNSNNNNVTKTYNGTGAGRQAPVYSAVSPPLLSSGNDSCLMSRSGSVQAVVMATSTGYYIQDEQCNRRKNAKTLKELGMSVAAVSLLCQDKNVWRAIFTAGTPCPVSVNGKLIVGRVAFITMRQDPEMFIPDYVENKEFYNRMLAIGHEGDINEEGGDSDGLSISERFRSGTTGSD